MSENYQSNIPDMPMKGHKFLIYFWLWLLALLAVGGGVSNIRYLGALQSAGFLEQLKGVPLIYLQTGMSFILAIYLIKVRFDLARFKASAPKSLTRALVLTAAVNLINVIFASMNNVPIESSMYMAPIMNIATMLCYRRYYNARDQYFVN